SYQLAKTLRNWNDTPILFSTWMVAICFLFNAYALLFLIDTLDNSSNFNSLISWLNNLKYIVGGLSILFIWLYYRKKAEKIVAKYEAKERKNGRSIHPVIILIIYYVVSFFIGMIAAMYRNNDGIFAQ